MSLLLLLSGSSAGGGGGPSSPPAFQSYTSAFNTTTVNKPASVASGDFLLLYVRTFFNDTITPPSGFTQIQTTQGRSALFWKKAGGSEPASYTLGSALTANLCILTMTRITGANATTPINASGVTNNSLVAPALTTTVDKCLHMAFCGSGGSAAIVVPGTVTSRYQLQNYVYDEPEDSFYRTNASMGSREQTTAGSTGTVTFTTTDTGGLGFASFSVAIAP